MSRSLSSGTTFPSPYRLVEPTDRTLDGLPLWAAPWPCDMAAAPSGSPGCCPDPMPTTLSFDLRDSTLGITTTYTLVWGNWTAWFGGVFYFWQYLASGTVADDVVSQIDYYCFGGSEYYPLFQAVVTFGSPSGTQTRLFFGPTGGVCCGAGVSDDFIWQATSSIPSSGPPTSGPPTSGGE